MSHQFDKYIETIEESGLDGDTAEIACDALSFAEGLHEVFVQNGMIGDGDVVDLYRMENLVDALFGELVAACIVLGTFEDTPKLIRNSGQQVKAMGDDVVPHVVSKGFERLATRVERTTGSIKAARQAAEQGAKEV